MLLKVEALKILFVLTSHSQMGDTGHKTGFWVEEFANPYYTLVDQGVEVTIATPKVVLHQLIQLRICLRMQRKIPSAITKMRMFRKK